MANEPIPSSNEDIDQTDRLKILDVSRFEIDVEDEAAAPFDATEVLPERALLTVADTHPQFARPPGVDLPSLAESVRSVEERIVRQNADYEALTRAYARATESEEAAIERADTLAADLAALRSALELEQGRSREMERLLADRNAAIEAARSAALEASRTRVEDALREAERYQSEARTLRDALAARDTTHAEVLRSLGERDAQLAALQAEHAKVMPVLEATSKTTNDLDAGLRAERARANALAAELQQSRETAAALSERLNRGVSETTAVRSDLAVAKEQAGSFLELLRTREWRRGFDQNVVHEIEARVGEAHAGHDALESERKRLQGELAALKRELSAHSSAAQAEQNRLTVDLAARDQALAEAHQRAAGEARKIADFHEVVKLRQNEHAAQIAQLRGEHAAQIAKMESEAGTQEEEMAVLIAHLQEARRPVQAFHDDVKRLTEELVAKTAALDASSAENSELRGTVERTRGALAEREFLIRRLERSESNNATVLGRIQTSIERLGSVPVATASSVGTAAGADWSAELVRIDGEQPVTHVLARRTRIGRAAGCEVHIDSGSVSRHHALVVVGPREAIIEDLNSTNGVLVNGRKVSRHVLADGDAITIGEAQYRYSVRLLSRAPDEPPPEPAA